MKVSLNWVKEFTKITLPPKELKERLSVSLTEVESMELFGEKFRSIIVVEVISVDKHPTSDSLLVLKINTGSRTVQVVVQNCPVKVGDKVPFLPPGTVTPGEIGVSSGGFSVSSTEIKGVRSEGMIPSGRELSLNHDHTTVYQLPSDTKVGISLDQALDLTDVIIEIKNKPLTHRPDVFSVEGFAREVAAVQNTPFKGLSWLKDWRSLKPPSIDNRLPIEIVNRAKALCPRYMAVVLDNVTVGPSPKWMQIRLAKVGIRPVNNIVDISNYLMLETGQPNHAFDYDKVIQKDSSFNGTATIVVRLAQGGERITTIDGELHELFNDTIVIADSSHPIGIAGVMGGKDTEITDETKRVIFQVENLDMYNIRRTSWKLGIFSDAVTRFSRGLDPNRCEPVLYKGIQMMQELAGAQIASAVKDDYESPLKEKSITVSPELIRRKVGFNLEDDEMASILRRLELDVDVDNKNKTITVTVPTFRRDLSIAEDIEEEIVRIYGYDRILPTLPLRTIHPVVMSDSRKFRMKLKRVASAGGANEIYTYSFVGVPLYQKCSMELDAAYKLRNALSPELAYMRPLLAPSLMDKFQLNSLQRDDFALFEIDKVNPLKSKSDGKNSLPEEPWHFALLHSCSFYDAKALLQTIVDGMGLSDIEVVPSSQVEVSLVPGWIHYMHPMLNLARTGYIRARSSIVGVIAQVSSDVCNEYECKEAVTVAEIDIESLMENAQVLPLYRNPSRYPIVEHDLCFVVESTVPYRAIDQSIRSADAKEILLRDVECLDIYIDENLENKKKVTVRVRMQSDDHTLTEHEIEKLREEIIIKVRSATGAEIVA